MKLAALAVRKKLTGDLKGYTATNKKALELEKQAAMSLIANFEAEPTRSVLFRSAATLALECDLQREAEQLVNAALAGNPPMPVLSELRELQEDLRFLTHLKTRGVSLAPEEFEMGLLGDEVGRGLIPKSEFVRRANYFETLAIRTFERIQKKPFREGTASSSAATRIVETYLASPTSGSFSVKFRLGTMLTPLFVHIPAVVKEISDCLDLYSKGDKQGLEKKISDPDYLASFAGIAKQLSPDDEGRIRSVTFASTVEGKTQIVIFRHRRSEMPTISKPQPPSEPEPKAVIEGVLILADSRRPKERKMYLRDAKGKEVQIVAANRPIQDVVKELFEERVRVTGTWKGKKVQLSDIAAIE